MSVLKSQPSIDPADTGSLAGALKYIIEKSVQNVDGMLPAKVLAFDRQKNRVDVQPMINVVTEDGDQVTRAIVRNLPVVRLSGAGVVMSFPLAQGDLGWIMANDRDISIYKQNGKQTRPNTQRKHNFNDAIFIPDALVGVTIPTEHQNRLTIQTLDGSSCAVFLTDNAALRLDSTTKAFMPPRMTTAQRDAIIGPLEGMVIWNLDTHVLNAFNGSNWA